MDTAGNDTTSKGSSSRPLARVVSFVLVTALLFVVALAASSRVRAGEYTILQGLTRNYLEPGGRFQTLRRFREVESRARAGGRRIDIVFLGASHTYRGFDPRVFAAEGYETMNLGSTNQTPLNTYYVAERYLAELSPRLVVLEVAYNTLTTDGLEACRDLLVNTPWSWSNQRMALATWNLGAIHFATAKGLGLLPATESTATQAEIEGEKYVAGGYCESPGQRRVAFDGPPQVFDLRSKQLDYLADASALARSPGAKIVWVTLPMPRDYVALVVNRDRLRESITLKAMRSGVDYWDFSELPLDSMTDFKDVLHLNAPGVVAFDRAFLDRLRASGYLQQE